ncbi:MAG: AsmA family protein [Kiloniellales bacterium]
MAAVGLLDQFDANITARIGALTVNRQPIKGIRFDGQIYAGTLTVRTAEVADFAGGRGKIKGSLRDLGTSPVVDMGFELAAPDAARVMKVAGLTPPDAVAKAGAMRLQGSAKGTVENLKIDTKLAAFAGNMRFTGALAGLNAAPSWDLRVTGRFPELRPVLAALGITTPKGKLGALNLGGVTKGSTESAALDAEISTGAGKMALKGTVAGLLEPMPRFDMGLEARGFQPQFLAAFMSDGPGREYLARLSDLNAQVRAKGDKGELDVTLTSVEVLGFGGKATLAGRIFGPTGAPRWDLRLDARYPELTPLLAVIDAVPAGAGAGRRLGAFTVTGTIEGGADALALDSRIGTGSGTMIIAGKVGDPFGERRTVDLTIDSRALQPQALAAFIADPGTRAVVGGVQGLDGKVTARGPLDALDLKLEGVNGHGFGGTVGVAGTVALSGETPRLDLKLDVRDVDLVGLGAAMGVRYRPRTPAVPLSLAGRFTGTLGQRIEGTGINGRFGYIDNQRQVRSTSFNGTVRAALAGARPKYTVELGFGDLFVDPYLARDQRQGELRRKYQLIPGVIRAAAPTIQPPARAGRVPWKRTPIDTALLRDVDADLVLNGNGLTYGKIQIYRPRLTLALAGGVLQIRELVGGFTEGGTINLTGTVDARDAISLAANLAISNADVHRAVNWFTPVDRVAGRLSIAGSLKARGRSQAELISTLNGKAKVSGSIRAGKEFETGVAQVIACLGLSSALLDHLKKLVPVSGAGVFGQYMDLATVVLANGVGDVSGDIQIDNGHMWSRNVQVTSRQGGGQAVIAGDVRLPAYTVYGQLELVTPESIRYSQQIGRPEPYVLAEYAADLDGNDKRTHVDGLFNNRNFKQTSCGSDTLGGKLGGKLGEVLGGALGGGQKAPQPQPDQQPAQQPQDLLKDLLGGGLGGLEGILKKQ